MHVVPLGASGARTSPTDHGRPGHQWVAATLVGMGEGDTRRAEHAARTGRHVLPSATRVEVLEVYCRRCRATYTPSAGQAPCEAVALRAAG